MTAINKKLGHYVTGKYFQERKNWILFVVPSLLFVFMLFRLTEINAFYQVWLDPVYAYLMNGLTFALGSTDIGHTDHPGTPLQLFIAFLIHIIGWVRGSTNLATDVITHPESYLRVISVALIAINCVMLWLLGFFAFKNLKSRNLAVFIQLIPLSTFQLINFLPIVACESFITLLSFGIAACILLYDNKNEDSIKLLVIIALLSALSVATKISTLPILIVPFFFFEKTKSKITYLLLTLLFIFLFISPVLGKLGNFTGFLEKLATHTGKYGSGEAKLFDYNIFLQSIGMMLTKEFPFTLHIILLPLGWLLIVNRNIDGSIRRLYVAITLATIFQVLIVARHYSFHYLMPVFALVMLLHAYFWIRYFKEKIANFSPRIVSGIIILLVFVVFTRLIVRNHFEKGITNLVEKTSQVIKSELKGNYIILTDNNGTAFVDPALKFGFSYSGASMKKIFNPILASAYPGNYFWNNRDGLTDWTGSLLPTDVFLQNNEIYIYANSGSSEVSMMNISEMIDQSGMSGLVELKKVFQNEKTGEVIARAIADTAQIIRNNNPILVIETSMEELSVDGEKIKSNNEEYAFSGAKLRSQQFARSGNSSLLLTPSNPFGLNISFPVSMGRRFKLEFWQRSSYQMQALAVASANQSNLFYKTSVQASNKKDGWTKSELNVSLPESYPEPEIRFYLYNPSTDSVWTDDFRIMVFE